MSYYLPGTDEAVEFGNDICLVKRPFVAAHFIAMTIVEEKGGDLLDPQMVNGIRMLPQIDQDNCHPAPIVCLQLFEYRQQGQAWSTGFRANFYQGDLARHRNRWHFSRRRATPGKKCCRKTESQAEKGQLACIVNA